jgi:uncharacterized protein (TIGR02284 family)
MDHPVEPLEDLIAATREGIDFYEHAAEAVESKNAKVLFRSMARVKREMIRALVDDVSALARKPMEVGTLAGFLRESYVRLKAGVSGNPQTACIPELEEHEQRLWEAFSMVYEEAQADPSQRHIAETLRVHLPRIQACRDEIHRLTGSET